MPGQERQPVGGRNGMSRRILTTHSADTICCCISRTALIQWKGPHHSVCSRAVCELLRARTTGHWRRGKFRKVPYLHGDDAWSPKIVL